MRSAEDINKYFHQASISTNKDADETIIEQLVQAHSESPEGKNSAPVTNIWRTIMKSRITKLTTAAAVLFSAILYGALFLSTTQTAHAIGQVIDAYDNIRFIYIKEFKPKQDIANEYWIQSDETGRVVRARYCLPFTEDGTKIITWTPEKTELWFKNKGGFLICQSKRIEYWMQSLLMQCQPKLVMYGLLEKEKSGDVVIDIQESQEKQKSDLIISTSIDRGEKEIYYINPATDLITHIEFYRIEDGRDVLSSTTEFHDYNVPIHEEMFSLKDEIPDNVRVSDRLNQLVGVPQDDMTDEQAAEETVRQFYQALIDKDYRTAGMIRGGMLEEHAKQSSGQVTISRIVSIGPAEPQLYWVKRGFMVPCTFKIVNAEGQEALGMANTYVRPGDDEMHPDRWNITGGMDVIELLPDHEKYKKITPREMAEAFFMACADENWELFKVFWPIPNDEKRVKSRERMKEYLGGLEVLSIGEPFQKRKYPGWYVPYEIKLKNGRLKKHNLAIRKDNAAERFMFDGGI